MDVNATGHDNAGVKALSTACKTGETGRLDESGEYHSVLARAYRQPGICPLRKQIERSVSVQRG